MLKGKAEGDLHDYSSTQVNVPEPERGIILEMAAQVAEEDLDLEEGGRETEPHITVKFGLHTNDPHDVAMALEGQGPVRLRFGKTTMFSREDKDYDVVKVDVESQDLHRLNERITAHAALSGGVTDTHPTYEPHATVAYVKRGLGEKYCGMVWLDGHECLIDTVWFSDLNRKLHPIALGRAKAYNPSEPRVPSGSSEGRRVKDAKAAAWKRIYKTRLAPAEKDFAERYSGIVRAIQKDTVASGDLRNLKRWKKRLSDEFEPWYQDHAESARDALLKQTKQKSAAFLFTKAKKPSQWVWADYKYGEVQKDGTVALNIDAMVEDHLDVLTGTLDTMDDRLDRELAAHPDGLTADQIKALLEAEFEEILDNGHVDDIATTETSWAENAGRLAAMAERDVTWHDWATAQDDRVRENHMVYGDQGAVPVGTNWARFVDEEYLLRWPHDDACESVAELANCRCVALPAVAPEDASEEEILALLADAVLAE
jgi:hypothetical protein